MKIATAPEPNTLLLFAAAKNDLRIFNPGRLETEDLIYNFCGSCHRNAFDAANNGASSITTIHFEPYRLVLSQCYNLRDRRISCLACHNPHRRMQQTAAFYDSKCLDCHDGPNRSASAGRVIAPRCRIATKNCVTCHMPKYELPGDHFKFADHDIRIIRLNDRFPG